MRPFLFPSLSAGVLPTVLHCPLGGLIRTLPGAAVRLLLLDGQARVRGGTQGADAALLRAERAREGGGQRGLVTQMSEEVAVVTGERQSQVQRARSRGGLPGEGQAVLLGERAPPPLFLIMHEARENVGPPLLLPLGVEVTQHDAAEEDSVERDDD